MQLLELYADNLYSFPELELDFTKYSKGTTIILGKNLNMNSSNGAGKTSILKSIFFSLWGIDIDRTPVSDIVHDQNPKMGFLTRIKFKDENHTYVVTRFKNYKNPNSKIKLHDGSIPKGSAVEFIINDDVFYMPKDNSKVESMVKGTLGMSSDIFLNSVLTAQKRSENFLKSPDSVKKELLSEILDLSQYDQAAKLVDKDIKEVKEQLKFKEQKINEYITFLEKIHDNLKELKSQSHNFSKNSKEKELEIEKELKIVKDDISLLKKDSLSKKDTSKINKEISSLEDKILKNSNLLQDLDKISKTYNDSNMLLAKISNNISNTEENIKEKNLKIKELREKNIHPEQLSTKLSSIDKELKQLEDKLKESLKIESNIKKINLLINELNIKIAHNEDAIVQLKKELLNANNNLTNSEKDNKCFTCERPFKKDNPLLKSLKESIISLEKNINTNNSLKKELVTKQELVKDELSDLEDKLKNFQSTIEKKDKLIIEKNSTENEINNNKILQEDILKLENNLIELSSSLSDNKEKETKLNINIKKYKDILDKLSTLELKTKELSELKSKKEKELFELEKFNLSLETLTEKVNSLENKKDSLEKELSNFQENKNPYLDLILKTSKELKEYESQKEKINTDIIKLNEKYKLLLFWEVGFSKNGIKSFIIDEIINLLNIKIKENLQILSEGTISLFFESEKVVKTKKTTKNEITTKIYINGKLRNKNSVSGGEEDRLTLAVDLALSDIAETRSGTRFSIKFLDEPFKWIDGKGQMKALALFNNLSEHKQGFFLISHDEKMQSFCENAIYVINENGQSRLVDKSTFMSLGSK